MKGEKREGKGRDGKARKGKERKQRKGKETMVHTKAIPHHYALLHTNPDNNKMFPITEVSNQKQTGLRWGLEAREASQVPAHPVHFSPFEVHKKLCLNSDERTPGCPEQA